MIPIGSTARSINEAFHVRVTCSDEHVKKTGNTAFIGSDRIGDRVRHGTESCLVKHVVDAITGVSARLKIADVSFNKGEPSPLFLVHSVSELFKINWFASGEVIQSCHPLI